jgi:hypothetical protein
MLASITLRSTRVRPRPEERARSLLAKRIGVTRLVAGTLAYLGLQNLLLWRFLDFAPAWLYLGGGVLALTAAGLASRSHTAADALTISLGRLAFCAGVSLLLFLLAGEGRWLYANLDWQVRDAVLRDMVGYPWPFAYRLGDVGEVLRAPLGMYLVSALVGKLGGMRAADIALLVQNSLFLAAILASMSCLFETTSRRLVALFVFLVFSGMDLFGSALLYLGGRVESFPEHLGSWGPVEYSSHITQIFWVPQHALAGWLATALFLLWKERRIAIGALLAAIPLLALWSPLAAMGAMPFVIYAGVSALVRRELRLNDILAPAVACIVTIPALLYLRADAVSVGGRLFTFVPSAYVIFMLLTIVPYIAGIALIGLRSRFAGATLAIAAGCLLLMPFYQIGSSVDFAMRATIPSLALLSVATADTLGTAFASRRARQITGAVILAGTLAIGSATGVMEIRRALINRPSPATHCSLIGSWDQEVGLPKVDKSTYFAPIASLPSWMQPQGGARVDSARDPGSCWARAWMSPR